MVSLLVNLIIVIILLIIPTISTFARTTSSGNETDLVALLSIKNQISSDPYGMLESWNHSKNHHCQWQGVTCNRKHSRITRLNLGGLSLSGFISPHIGNLSFLRFINLSYNQFSGEIPQEIGRLRRLRYAYLSSNSLVRKIPLNISHCLQLRALDLSRNMVVGNLPWELGNLRNLELLSLGNNNLTGEIPSSIGNLTSLKRINVQYNNLIGNLPQELGQLTRLNAIILGPNNFSTGIIPPSLYNISSLSYFTAPLISLQGTLPSNIGFNFPNLVRFQIGGNYFHGTIPDSFANASFLVTLDLGSNNFRGKVPNNLGRLKNLVWLNVQWNNLGSNSKGDLDFIQSLSNCSDLDSLLFGTNNFGGEIPYSIGNLSSKLRQLDLGFNQISGQIPASLGNLDKLYLLGFDNNFFSGAVPCFLGKFQNLQRLFLRNNSFSGQIPPSLCNNFTSNSLFFIRLDYNSLEGSIPSTIGNCKSLQVIIFSKNNLVGSIPPEIFTLSSLTDLILSDNSFSGTLPPEIGSLNNLFNLDISNNKISGEIPRSIGKCLKLEYLRMQGNLFQGTIPKDIALIKGIRLLDLSRNNMTGEMPKEFEELPFMELMNLSFNNFEGELPSGGFWSNTSAISLLGNQNLCGGISQLQLPSCIPSKEIRSKNSVIIRIFVPLGATGLIILFTFIIFYVYYWIKKRKSSDFVGIEFMSRISYQELQKATDNFSESNLIGLGSFGTVYKGTLDDEKLVAVKVLNNRAYKSFVSECKVLRNVRHRNLVRVLTCCSSNDFQRREFKALVYEYMPNGDLDMWLHEKNNNGSVNILSMIQRLSIAIDVAFALDYLHNHSQIPIVHCDLKPSNILIDHEFTAHVGDFGLARLLNYHDENNPSQPFSSSIGIKGSLGYAAPGNVYFIYTYIFFLSISFVIKTWNYLGFLFFCRVWDGR